MNRTEALSQIAEKRREFVESGGEPYAVLLGDGPYHALAKEDIYTLAEKAVYDPLIEAIGQGSIVWWSEREHEKAEDAWLDAYGY